MTDRLDAALADLGAEIAFPPTPDLRAGVAARLARPEPRRWWAPRAWPRALALAVIATLAAAATVAALAFVLPGLRITFLPSLPSAAAPDGLALRYALGEPVALESVDVALPAALGPPDEAYASHDGDVVSLVWVASDDLPEIGESGIGLLVQEISGSLERERIEKLVLEFGSVVTPVEVDGADGFWITGPPHVIRYTGPDGGERTEATRLVSDSLVWNRGGTLMRIESALGLEATRRIGESFGE